MESFSAGLKSSKNIPMNVNTCNMMGTLLTFKLSKAFFHNQTNWKLITWKLFLMPLWLRPKANRIIRLEEDKLAEAKSVVDRLVETKLDRWNQSHNSVKKRKMMLIWIKLIQVISLWVINSNKSMLMILISTWVKKKDKELKLTTRIYKWKMKRNSVSFVIRLLLNKTNRIWKWQCSKVLTAGINAILIVSRMKPS